MMKKISMMVIALLAAITMSAETVTVDTLTSAAFGFDKQSTGYTELSTTGAGSGVSYKAVANGAQKYIQIRTNDNTSGVASTTTGGYIKSVQVVQNTEKGAKEVQIYGANTALAGPADLYDASKTTKLGALTSLDQTFTMTENYTYIGVRSASGARYLDKIIITWTDTKPGTDPGVWTPDTISVSEARALIDKGDVHTHYLKGVVASAPFILSSKNYTVWMTDIDNPSDSIQAFTLRKSKTTTDLYTSVEEMAKDFGLNDTVLIFAEGISKYQSTYETTSGYYVETLGKSSAKNANDIFKYAVGAVEQGKDSIWWKYELVLSKTDIEGFDNALHVFLNSSNEKGIAGTYSIYRNGRDSSYVDGEGEVLGSFKLTYNSQSDLHNVYSVYADFTINGSAYHMDTTYAIAGWLNDYSDQFILSDDRPFVPQEGDTITCAQAASYARSLGAETGVNVYVHGFVTGCQTIKGRSQQSPYMADDAAATKGVFQGYLCYTQRLDSIIKGDEIIVYGPVSYYEAQDKCQISKGKIYRIGGSDTQRPRSFECVEAPVGAISVAEALNVASQLTPAVGATDSTATEYTVVGYIVNVAYQTDGGNASWYMHDEQGEYGEFQAYKCAIPTIICEDDKVYLTGRIYKYQKSADEANIEIKYGTANFVCASTGIEEIAPAPNKQGAQKVIKNGQLYILKDGVLFNALGTVVQ